jgi:hypothetical protein
MHSTNYLNTFIEVSDDCKAAIGTVPPEKKRMSIARMQYDMIKNHPYKYSSDDVIFTIYAVRNRIQSVELEKTRTAFFSKGQACLRSSPLGKLYGWGIHFDDQSRIAIYAKESKDYGRLKADKQLKHLKAMKNSR